MNRASDARVEGLGDTENLNTVDVSNGTGLAGERRGLGSGSIIERSADARGLDGTVLAALGNRGLRRTIPGGRDDALVLDDLTVRDRRVVHEGTTRSLGSAPVLDGADRDGIAQAGRAGEQGRIVDDDELKHQKLLSLGAARFMTKPFAVDELVYEIGVLVTNRSLVEPVNQS